MPNQEAAAAVEIARQAYAKAIAAPVYLAALQNIKEDRQAVADANARVGAAQANLDKDLAILDAAAAPLNKALQDEIDAAQAAKIPPAALTVAVKK